MKLLHTTDLHFKVHWFRWIEEQQDKYDVFCVSGDFLEDSQDNTLEEQIKWITNWIKNFKKPLFVCSGNHDIAYLENENWLNDIDTTNYYPDNSVKTINEVKFGSYPFIGSDGYYNFDECDVLITHLPPTNTQTSTDKKAQDWGDKELERAIKNKIISANIILCGHMHHPSKTVDRMNNISIYNPGVNKNSRIPNHHVIQM